MQRRVRLQLRGLYGLEDGRCDVPEGCVGFMDLMLFGIGQRGKLSSCIFSVATYLTKKCCPDYLTWRAPRKYFAIPLHVWRQEFPCQVLRAVTQETIVQANFYASILAATSFALRRITTKAAKMALSIIAIGYDGNSRTLIQAAFTIA